MPNKKKSEVAEPHFTKRQRQDYVADLGTKCPYCRSKKIHVIGDVENIETDEIRRGVECEKCSGTWQEILRLSDVRPL